MSRALLDVNVLLALLDSDHVDHVQATAWLRTGLTAGWSSCPLTENGFVRIISQPGYPSPVPPATAITLLRGARDGGSHDFWPDDLSVLDDAAFDRARLLSSRQITDSYCSPSPLRTADVSSPSTVRCRCTQSAAPRPTI